ncbi:MAG: hypothetical protein PHF67_02370 [Candidatus Nanoarchaeia archaeon]|nr:hypothetical protein [Candidatus Nanoarchaeia archaeon]
MELEEFLSLRSLSGPLQPTYRNREKDRVIIQELKLVYATLADKGVAKDLSREGAEAIIWIYTYGKLIGFAKGALEGMTGDINPSNQTYSRHFLQPNLAGSKRRSC